MNSMFDPSINKSYVPFDDNPNYPNDERFFDDGGEPIWVTNQRQNNEAKSGVVMWVGGRYSVKWSRPTFYMPYNSKVSSKQRIDQVIQWFTQEEPINLGLVYFDEPDLIGHHAGPDSDELAHFIATADKLLEYIGSSFEKKGVSLDLMNVIITSDHGMTAVSNDNLIILNDIIPHDWFSQIVQYSPMLSIIPMPGMEERLYRRLKEAANKPNSHFQVWKRDDIPERFHYKHNIRVTPIVALADLHYNFIYSIKEIRNHGTHGYDNKFPDMHPFFLARGPSFKKDFAVDTFDSVDVYPLMCHLLNIDPAPNNGSLHTVSRLLATHETTMWTFETYIFVLIFVSCVGGIFTVCACRQHRYLKRMKFQNRQLSFQGGIRYSVPSKGNAVVKLLSDEDDDVDDDCMDMLSHERRKYNKISH